VAEIIKINVTLTLRAGDQLLEIALVDRGYSIPLVGEIS
jgi:hypothetical protein